MVEIIKDGIAICANNQCYNIDWPWIAGICLILAAIIALCFVRPHE
jgi:hypothetical protein